MFGRCEIPREAVAIAMRTARRSQGGGRLDGGQSGHVFAVGLGGLCTWKLGRARPVGGMLGPVGLDPRAAETIETGPFEPPEGQQGDKAQTSIDTAAVVWDGRMRTVGEIRQMGKPECSVVEASVQR